MFRVNKKRESSFFPFQATEAAGITPVVLFRLYIKVKGVGVPAWMKWIVYALCGRQKGQYVTIITCLLSSNLSPCSIKKVLAAELEGHTINEL